MTVKFVNLARLLKDEELQREMTNPGLERLQNMDKTSQVF